MPAGMGSATLWSFELRAAVRVTTWPVDPFGEQSDATTARIEAAAGSPVTSASETQPTTGAANGSTLIAVGKRPLGTFPETPPYPASF